MNVVIDYLKESDNSMCYFIFDLELRHDGILRNFLLR